MEFQRIALNVTEFAKAIGVSKSTAYALIRDGKVVKRHES
jgi:predicted DNA-binding transcriptional regulator AlpA